MNAIFLPAVLAFNRDSPSAQRGGKYARLAQAMNLTGPGAVEAAVSGITARLGLPTGLAQLDVTREMFPRIIKGALADHSHKTNPREASAEDYQRMLEQSM